MIRTKLRSRRGLTLAETLTALAIFAILSVVLVYGTTAAWKVYRSAVTASEARTLQSTLSQALTSELRYAQNIRNDGTDVVFDSDVFGDGVSVRSLDGRVQIGTDAKAYDLLGEKAYTSGLKANAEVTYDRDNGLFTVELTITQEALNKSLETSLTIQALNPPG